MTPQHLTHIEPEANMRRYYRLRLQPGLFGDIGLVREWGRIGRSGQSRTDWFTSEAEAEVAKVKLAGQKLRRGYR